MVFALFFSLYHFKDEMNLSLTLIFFHYPINRRSFLFLIYLSFFSIRLFLYLYWIMFFLFVCLIYLFMCVVIIIFIISIIMIYHVWWYWFLVLFSCFLFYKTEKKSINIFHNDWNVQKGEWKKRKFCAYK